MIDDPEAAVSTAIRHLAPGGTLHVVDFGDMAGLPRWARLAMSAWLARFHVRHRPEVEATVRGIALARGWPREVASIAGGYGQLLRLRAH